MPTFELIKSLSFLVGIIALIYICFYLYKKKAGLTSRSHQRITLIERRVIDQRTTISLVRIDERELVLVSHQQSIAIHALPDATIGRSFKDIALAKTAVQ